MYSYCFVYVFLLLLCSVLGTLIVLFCVLYYRHRVSTQLQLIYKNSRAPGPLPDRCTPVTCTGFHPFPPRIGTDLRAKV
jgi:hypothetical protein